MKFACLSDTHGRAPSMSLDGCDVVLHAGDFYNELGVAGWEEGNRIERLKEWIKDLTIPAYGVRGNHDCEDPAEWFLKHHGAGVHELAPHLFLIGLSWTGERYFDLPLETDMGKHAQEVMKQACWKMKDGDMSIVLTHWPGDYKTEVVPGFVLQVVRKLTEAVRPLAVVTGHIHDLANHSYDWNGTLIVHAGKRGCLLDVDLANQTCSVEDKK